MPEGDTIFRAAQTLHRALAGSVVRRFETVLPALSRIDDDTPLAGRTIERVWSTGKHLLMQFSGNLVLRTHMRMNGSWHIYRAGERWKRSRRDMRIVIGTSAFEAVGFNIPVAEFVAARALERHDELRRLGPDLLASDFDAAEAMRRFRARAALMIADALVNQRVVAGVGNVYKSEVLFACRVSPFATVASLTDAQLTEIIGTARRFLRANAAGTLPAMTTYTGYRRTTRSSDPSQRLWVYGRGGKPCRRCDTPIAVRKHGDDARLTYWCPTCQGPEGQGPRGTKGPRTLMIDAVVWIALAVGAAAAAAALYGFYRVLPGWLTGPKICRLEAGGCAVLFRSPRAALLGVPNSALGLLLYALLAAGLLLRWPALLLLAMMIPAVAMSIFLGYSLIANRRECRICWAGHFANAALFLALLARVL